METNLHLTTQQALLEYLLPMFHLVAQHLVLVSSYLYCVKKLISVCTVKKSNIEIVSHSCSFFCIFVLKNGRIAVLLQ